MQTEVGTDLGEDGAMAAIAEYVRAIRRGDQDPPYGLLTKPESGIVMQVRLG